MTGRQEYDSRLAGVLRRAGELFHQRAKEDFQSALEEALAIAPMRLDIQLCLASHFIQVDRPDLALTQYDRLAARFPRDPDLLFHLAHWRRHGGDRGSALATLSRLRALRPERAADLERLWSIVDIWDGRPAATTLPDIPSDVRIGVVTLGHRLAADGAMLPPLRARLEKTLEAAGRWPGARIIVTGGVPQAGMVEAVAMRRWLVERGVNPARIVEEGYARDSVENVLFSRPYLDRDGIERVIAVTSDGNVARTGAAFMTAAWVGGSEWSVNVVAADSSPPNPPGNPSGPDIKVYRDVLRAYGLPMMACYPFLAER